MRLHVLSDLHLEFAPLAPKNVGADAVILAGDIATGVSGLGWAASSFKDVPVVYVPGNHEAYGYEYTVWREAIRAGAAQTEGVSLLDESVLRIHPEGENPVAILGLTLWTDFALFGDSQVERAGMLTQRALADYRAIRLGDRLLRWEDTLALHQKGRAWLVSEVMEANARGDKVIVVSHHAPSLASSALCYREDPVTAGFASDLEAFAREHVDLWIHGHMHNSSDYRLGRCRVVANPRGYPLQRWNPDTPYENRDFNPALVIEI